MRCGLNREKTIVIRDAHEGNLKHISLEIPKDKLVVLTGLSGSGKSTLAIDTLYQECQRQYLEAIGYQGIQKPKVDAIYNLSPAIKISQVAFGKNPRSSVGTVTNIATDLRMIFEKLSMRSCPACKRDIAPTDCKENLEKHDGTYTVFMYCHHCGHKMKKLTGSYFSNNTREGACEVCHGLGEVLAVDQSQVIQESLSLEDGAVDFWVEGFKSYQISVLYHTFDHYGIPYSPDTPVAAFTEVQMDMLLYGFDSERIKARFPEVEPPRTVAEGRFEGIVTALWRRLSEKGGMNKALEAYFTSSECPACHGDRLGTLGRNAVVGGTRFPELMHMSLDGLNEWICRLEAELRGNHLTVVAPYLLDLKTKIRRICNVGLGYLSLDRQTMTLSGGEAQRIKLSATLDSTLTGIIYIMDEPTVGLHPKDTAGIIGILNDLRDLGNTVIVIEHDPDVMAEADVVIDIGPGSGKHGGEVVGLGTLEALMAMETSVTGAYLGKPKTVRSTFRKGTGEWIGIRGANRFNLKQVDVDFPVGCLTCVTGVSGSGKTTLIFEVLANGKGVSGLDRFDRIIAVEQSPMTRMKRSNVATYSGLYGEIRQIFGALKEAKAHGLSARSFSFNTKGGRCEHCEGLGVVSSHMLFFEDLEVQCPVCEGKQFNETVLAITYKGYTIKDILLLSVTEAMEVFKGHSKLLKMLKLLEDVGLGYLELGQTLTTLSGGEAQRLKLAEELFAGEGKRSLYLIDEPTTGLHPVDVAHFLVLLDRLVDAGNTIIVVEHNQQLIGASDWIVDLGPEGGVNGGRIIATGTPEEIKQNPHSVTGMYL